MKTVSVEGLSEALVQTFADYTEEVEDLVAKEVEETAKITQAEIKANSPVRTGKYQRGWSRRKSSKGGHTVYTIYNKDKPGLVHLLEKGWTTRKGNRVAGRPHVKPAYDKHVKTMPERIEKLIEAKRGG